MTDFAWAWSAALVLAIAGGASTPDVGSGSVSAIGVSGVVFDSLSGTPLAGADVQLLREGASARTYDARTDSAGRFTISTVEAGEYVAGFFHPRLDSLGIDLPPVRVTLNAESQVELRLATPSRRTIISAVCPDSMAGDDATLLLGAVRDAARGERLTGAVVSAQWSGLAFQDAGLVSVEFGGMVPATAEGRFAVCNIPLDADVTLRAAVGADTSGALSLQFPPLGILARDIFVAPIGSDEPNASARLSGRVTSTTGAAVAGARLSLWGFPGAVRTDETGAFVFAEVPGGSTTLDVRAVGYEPVRIGIDLRTDAQRNNTVALVVARAPTTLAPITILDTRTSGVLLRSGFDKRAEGGVGRFLDAEALEKMQVVSTTSAIARFPGMLSRTSGRGSRLFMRDPKGVVCAPMVWVDGTPYSPNASADVDVAIDIDHFANPDEIAGIEVYRRVSQAPLQYAGTTQSACGVVVIWRKNML
ncbi:MAG: carboxypeptidase regulatory-like domain-containing protein [Gemmatimonadetes bacterium]|nr:carboxypeptidase regulatory-like domain-containing protein [Gemmatimonadota bacterium]MCC6769648.1 carboxypeptidase regulatory-like domain-containing protein [Gemmatimonadaceae bacterium]